MSRGMYVRITGTNMEGKITQVGNNGMVAVNITINYNPFARSAYHESELEVIAR